MDVGQKIWNRLAEDPAIREILLGMEVDRRETLKKRAQANPKANKLTTVMAKSANYRYFSGGKNKRGDRIVFCYSCWRNAAGYFLSWREVTYKRVRKDGTAGKRDQWAARKVRKRAAALAKRRAERALAVAAPPASP